MEYQYSIEDLASKCKVSKQSIYNLISKNKEFVKQNSKKQQRKIKYNQAVLDLLLDYYGGDDTTATTDETTIAATETPLETPAEATAAAPASIPTDDKDAKIDALQAEIEALKQQLQEKEAERKELLTQNGALILTIQQQQQEKMALLPAPKKTIGERIKGFFGKG